MSQLDKCHQQVLNALAKEGWVLRKNQVYLAYRQRIVYIDAVMVRSWDRELILIEIKCITDDMTTEVYAAIGQYLIYREMIRLRSEGELFLAIPTVGFDAAFDDPVMEIVKRENIQIVVIDLELEEVSQWIPAPP